MDSSKCIKTDNKCLKNYTVFILLLAWAPWLLQNDPANADFFYCAQ